jgi:hypothetical protein
MRVEETKKKEFDDKYDQLSDDDKYAGASGFLGESLV